MSKRNVETELDRLLSLKTLYFILIFLGIISILGLDYLNWKQGEKAYFFDLFLKKETPAPSQTLAAIIENKLSSWGISSETIQKYHDKENNLHLKVNLSLEEYQQLSPLLEKVLQDTQVSIIKMEELHDPDRDYFLWELGQEPERKILLLFACAKTKKEIPESEEPRPQTGRVALIIDDMGYSLEAVKEICALKKPVTLAVLPYSPLARETASLARRNGLEVILHLPLESLNENGRYNDIQGIIRADMDREEIIDMVSLNLQQVPFIKGVNNHMGSKITADGILMRTILEQIQGKNLYFIDSMTTGRSIAYRTARSLGIPAAFRHVFLDAERNEESVRRRLIELFQTGRQKGTAVGICHPVGETLRVLKKNISLAGRYNIRFVFASQVVR